MTKAVTFAATTSVRSYAIAFVDGVLPDEDIGIGFAGAVVTDSRHVDLVTSPKPRPRRLSFRSKCLLVYGASSPPAAEAAYIAELRALADRSRGDRLVARALGDDPSPRRREPGKERWSPAQVRAQAKAAYVAQWTPTFHEVESEPACATYVPPPSLFTNPFDIDFVPRSVDTEPHKKRKRDDADAYRSLSFQCPKTASAEAPKAWWRLFV
ncbi:hypothetical protein SPRG_07158 [Saprolegnia parasitica CBS 223.65]|uniref:Uncharacterized protein n=1 Tax=Saprolegnia parasitica (strain CBS 223.65) TaxID=695850 RepID=A0A067CMX2_SAPPC|nr:hypothetical protein SPRG_07158 [Saprolegnia parasitica CBS 223.65]KDO27886.1 hypothetical protein SPRG_07158 [Saprolegnia parasitica CBS 223.65]|eukprot:XP_012201343.1 hypothetical protein SPRG_07158 [Saprolegnia parasitica CBS 223.65]